MNVLGFDTSTAATSVCVLRSDGRAFELVPEVAALASPPAHAAELLPAVAELMDAAGVGFGDLARIAVGVGPGTFTGLRIGVATARGLALASSVPVHPVSSLAALAAGIDVAVAVPLIDAKRGELFGAGYRDGELVVEPFVAAPGELAARLAALGPGGTAAGDGSLRFRDVLEAAGMNVTAEGSPSHVVRAFHVCRLAQTAPRAAPGAVLPTYLRSPDAQPSI